MHEAQVQELNLSAEVMSRRTYQPLHVFLLSWLTLRELSPGSEKLASWRLRPTFEDPKMRVHPWEFEQRPWGWVKLGWIGSLAQRNGALVKCLLLQMIWKEFHPKHMKRQLRRSSAEPEKEDGCYKGQSDTCPPSTAPRIPPPLWMATQSGGSARRTCIPLSRLPHSHQSHQLGKGLTFHVTLERTVHNWWIIKMAKMQGTQRSCCHPGPWVVFSVLISRLCKHEFCCFFWCSWHSTISSCL